MSAAPAGYTIQVKGLSTETTEEKLHDFFSFCGKLVSVKKNGSEADITFEKLSAMRTSLMLNGGTLDGAHLEVTSASDIEPKASVLPTGATGSTPIGTSTASGFSQEDKPRAAIVAEYLAHGYVLSDRVVQQAIDFDHERGISSRFLGFFNSIDQSVGHRVIGEEKTVSGTINEQAAAIVAKSREADQHHGVSKRFGDYYNKVVGTPIGQKVHSFYTTTQKQVLDVHEEAKRLAEEKKRAAGGVAADIPGAGAGAAATTTGAAVPTTAAAPAASNEKTSVMGP